jgi:hypothetical protein
MEPVNELALSGPDVTATDLAQGSILFVGTATVILRYAGITILTDPNFLHRGDHHWRHPPVRRVEGDPPPVPRHRPGAPAPRRHDVLRRVDGDDGPEAGCRGDPARQAEDGHPDPLRRLQRVPVGPRRHGPSAGRPSRLVARDERHVVRGVHRDGEVCRARHRRADPSPRRNVHLFIAANPLGG